MLFSRVFKLLFAKDGFLKKQTNNSNKKKSSCKLSHCGMGSTRELSLRTSATELLPAHGPRFLEDRYNNSITSSSTLFPSSLPPWDAGGCLPVLAAGTSHSLLSVAWGGGSGAELVTCGWVLVMSIFQPESPALPLEKKDHR